MLAARVRADAKGISMTDGTRSGFADQHALWDDVAHGTVEKRALSPDEVGTPHLVLKDAAGADLFVLYLRFLARGDTARLLRFIGGELGRRDVPFDVPAKYKH